MGEDKDLGSEIKAGAKVEGDVDVTKFEEYLVKRRVGISSKMAQELQGYVNTLRDRDRADAEAWSLIVSVEQWRQARCAFFGAMAIGVVAIVLAMCSLLVAICSLGASLYQTRILGG